MSRRLRAQPQRSAPAARGADLHVHTTRSDGSCSPGAVVRSAASVGLGAVAITDHDTLRALAPAQREAERLGIELVPGVELSAAGPDDGRESHLLGYFFDSSHPALTAALDRLRAARLERVQAMAERLERLGFRVDLEALRRAFPRAALGRRHLALWLVRTGQVAAHRLVFERYLGDDGPAFVPKPLIPWPEAIALVLEAGGAVGLAHPGRDWPRRRLWALREAGLGALEVDGPKVGRRQAARLRSDAEALGLIPIAGSDFHEPGRPGAWVGSVATPLEDLERLRAAARWKRSVL